MNVCKKGENVYGILILFAVIRGNYVFSIECIYIICSWFCSGVLFFAKAFSLVGVAGE